MAPYRPSDGQLKWRQGTPNVLRTLRRTPPRHHWRPIGCPSPISCIFSNDACGYHTLTIGRPMRDADGKVMLFDEGKPLSRITRQRIARLLVRLTMQLTAWKIVTSSPTWKPRHVHPQRQ